VKESGERSVRVELHEFKHEEEDADAHKADSVSSDRDIVQLAYGELLLSGGVLETR